MRSLGWALIQRDRCPDKRHTQKAGHVKTEAKIGVMLSHTKECLGLPEARGGRKDLSLKVVDGAWPCQQLEFGLLASRAV